ncbi:MAG: Gfo/Idh/MocA family protein [Gammaproteobacteria bacterium]
MRTAVVGMGKLGLLHAATLNVLPACRLVAVADPSDQVVKAFRSKKKDVATFRDHQSLLGEVGPDVVAVTTPTGLHCQVASDCIDANAHVFIEKPLCLVPEDAEPLLSSLRQNPRVAMVGYMTRFLPTFEKAKEIVDRGILGKLQMLRSSMYVEQLFRKGKGWRYDPAVSGGGVLMTQNCHLIDMLLWMFGKVRQVNANVSQLYSSEVEDHAHVFFDFESGLKGFFDASWSTRHYRTPTMRIHVQGERGTLDVDDDQVSMFLTEDFEEMTQGWRRWRKPDLYDGVAFDIGGENYTKQAMEFIAAIRGEGNIGSDIDSALRVQRVITAAYESAKAGGAPVTPE